MVVVLDPCGIFCVVVTYLIVFYADYVVMFHLIKPVLKEGFAAIFNTVAFNLIAFLLVLSHLCAVFGDPGLMPLGQYPLTHDGSFQKPQGWTACARCSMFRPPRAHHCRVCRRCVRRMDHHCPWVNNCVGEYNQKYFILFLIYTGALCLYALILVIVCRAVLTAESGLQGTDVDPFVVAHTVLLIAICCLFGLFVLAILSDQYKSIVDDETAVEALQQRLNSGQHSELDVEVGQCRRRLPKRFLFREVFGTGPVCLWLLPCHHMWRSSKSASPCTPLFVRHPTPNPDIQSHQSTDSERACSTETDSASL